MNTVQPPELPRDDSDGFVPMKVEGTGEILGSVRDIVYKVTPRNGEDRHEITAGLGLKPGFTGSITVYVNSKSIPRIEVWIDPEQEA